MRTHSCPPGRTRLRAPTFPLVLLALLVLLGASPARAGAPALPAAAPWAGLDALDPLDPADRDPARLERLGGFGRAWVRTAPIPWGALEPAPPHAGVARYDWKALDEAVVVWQLAGLDPVLVLEPRSPWASVPAEDSDWFARVRKTLPAAEATEALRGATGCAPPRPERWRDWQRFVQDVVERYDGDGVRDAPGLRRPVRHVQVLGRVDPAAWLGSAADTLRLLHHAGLALEAADPRARLLAPALDLRATGHDPRPDEREWTWRIDHLVAPGASPLARLEVQRAFGIARRLLEMVRLVDVVCLVGSGNLDDDAGDLAFLRQRLDAGGGRGKGLWLVADPTRKLDPPAGDQPGPDQAELRLRRHWLAPALDPRHGEHAKAAAWLRRGQAFDLVRSLCRARAAGADVVLLEAPADRPCRGQRRGRAHEGQGLLARAAGGRAGERRTASWYALGQALDLLGGAQRVDESRFETPGRSIIFHLAAGTEPAWVAVLLLDPRLSWAGVPGTPPARRDVLVPVPSGTYLLEEVRTGPGAPRRERVTAREGVLSVSLGPAPAYIIPLH
jgi:hypothetical protein